MKKIILSIIIMLSLLSCRNNNTDNLNNSTSNNDSIFNDNSKKPFKERLVNYADWYCKNNFKDFAGHKMSASTSDILRLPAKPKKKEEYYVFRYSGLTDDLKYMLEGDVLIIFENNAFLVDKNYVYSDDNSKELSNYSIAELGGGEKILFSRKY